MRIIAKNPEYLPLQNRDELREAAERRERIEALRERELTPVAIALLQAAKS